MAVKNSGARKCSREKGSGCVLVEKKAAPALRKALGLTRICP